MVSRRLFSLPRRFAFAGLCALALGSSVQGAEVEFIRVWPEWRDAITFARISEYFTGQENFGDREVRRSDAKKRAGFYFLTRVKHPAVSLVGAHFVLWIITPAAPEAKRYTFPADTGPGEQLFELGLTGADWAGRKVHPVAWRLDLLAPDGHSLAWTQSFLWALPPGPHVP